MDRGSILAAVTMDGDELKAIRKSLGHTQKSFARQLGIRYEFLGGMERGKADIVRRTSLAVRYIESRPDVFRAAGSKD